MSPNLQAFLLSLPNGILGHFGKHIGSFVQTSTTKIIENVTQGFDFNVP